MKKLAIIVGLLMISVMGARGQVVAVTGSVVDGNGNTYSNGSMRVSLEDANGNDLSNTPVNVGGTQIFLPAITTGLSSTGTFTVNLYPNSQIGYSTSTKWEFSICSQIPVLSPSTLTPPQTCFENVLTITGAGSITGSLTPTALSVTVPSGISNTFAKAVNGTTVSALPSASSATNQAWYIYDGTSATDCATGGGSTKVLCGSNGTTWAAVSGGGGGGLNGTVTYTANQTASTSDNGKTVIMNCSSACAYTLPNPQPSTTWQVNLQSTGSTVATIALGSSMTYNGGSTVPTLTTNVIYTIAANTTTSTDYRGQISSLGPGAVIKYVSQLGCAAQNVDLNTGLQPNGSAATDDSTCLNNALATATPQHPIILWQDGASLGHIKGPPGGGWGIVGGGGGVARVNITAWSITSNVVTFTFTNSTSTSTLAANTTVQLGSFGTSTFFNGVSVKVLAAGLSSTQFEANFTHANGSATETGEADYLFGTGFYPANGTNDDVIDNGVTAGNCIGGYSFPGWNTSAPGLAPSRIGQNYIFKDFVINGNRGNGTTGNSTSGFPQGTNTHTTLYGGAGAGDLCWYTGLNIWNASNILVDNLTIYNTPSFNTYFNNVGDLSINNSHFLASFPNQPISPSVVNIDSIHIGGPSDYIRGTNNYMYTNDDPIAINAAEGYTGAITDVQFTNTTVAMGYSCLRMYTASIAPPSGDATPLVKRVGINTMSCTSQTNFGEIGYGLGSARTLTVQNSITDVTIANSRFVGALNGFITDDDIGGLTFSNDQFTFSSSVGANTGIMQATTSNQKWNNIVMSDVKIKKTASASHPDAFITDTTGTGSSNVTIGVLELNNIGVMFEGGTGFGSLPQAVYINGGSSAITELKNTGVDYQNITTLIPSSQASKVTFMGPSAIQTMVLGIEGATVSSASTIALSALLTHISGTTTITNINGVSGLGGQNALCGDVVADGAWATSTGGTGANKVLNALTAVPGTMYHVCYSTAGAGWYIK